MAKIAYWDSGRQMFVEMAKDDKMHDCSHAIAIFITKDGEVFSGRSWEEDRPMPFVAIGALEAMKREVMHHIEEGDR